MTEQLSLSLHTHRTERKQSLDPREDGRSDQKPVLEPGVPKGNTHRYKPGKCMAYRRTKGYLFGLGQSQIGRKTLLS